MNDDEQKKIFAENLCRYIERSGKDQKTIAIELGIAPTTFNTWCVGKILPSVTKIQMIADYFNIGMSYLVDDKSNDEQHYYIDDDAREMAEFLHKNPDYKVLFDASRNVKKEDIEFVKQMLDKFKGND